MSGLEEERSKACRCSRHAELLERDGGVGIEAAHDRERSGWRAQRRSRVVRSLPTRAAEDRAVDPASSIHTAPAASPGLALRMGAAGPALRRDAPQCGLGIDDRHHSLYDGSVGPASAGRPLNDAVARPSAVVVQ